MGTCSCCEDPQTLQKPPSVETMEIISIPASRRSFLISKQLHLSDSFSEVTSSHLATLPSPRDNFSKYGPKLVSPAGWTYYGAFDGNGHKTGEGVFIWEDGSRYVGYWLQNMANGKGTLYYADGDVYIGDWVNDKAHGCGKYLYPNGTVYEGEWLEDKQHGYGVETWPGGGFFKGNFVDNLKCGYGEFLWNDGRCFKGDTWARGLSLGGWEVL